MGKRRVVIVVALACVVAVFAVLTSARHGLFDLQVYYGALNHWVDGGDIYTYLRPRTPYGFTYPPFAALTMLPMAFLPWPVVMAISVTATVLCTAVGVWWLVEPVARREGWPRWFVLAVALCLVAALEPVRETVTFGQVNVLLLVLVAGDLLWLVARGSRWAGLGIGLAAAVKLTPGIFVLYLLITRRWRAAAVAVGTAAAATLLAAALAPAASREFWTHALWNTDRVGNLSYVSNQSLAGMLARLDGEQPNLVAWLLLVVAVLAVWAWRVRTAAAAGDEAAGLALTGVAGCLISPVTWVHHLVWLVPALVLLADAALAAAPGGRRRGLAVLAGLAYALLISRIVWIWLEGGSGVVAFLGSNAYLWVSLALLVALPVRRPSPEPTPADEAVAQARAA